MKVRLCLAWVVALLLVSDGRGQTDPATVNPIYNSIDNVGMPSEQPHAWVVRNDFQSGHPKESRQAIVLYLKATASGDNQELEGTLRTYDIRGRKYKHLRDVALTGWSNAPPSSNRSRKRIKFYALGTHRDNPPRTNVVIVAGFYQSGNDGKTHGSGTRTDDRLSVRVIDKPVEEYLGMDASPWSFIFATNGANPPCDETPDDDILEEEEYDMEDPDDPLDDEEVDPAP